MHKQIKLAPSPASISSTPMLNNDYRLKKTHSHSCLYTIGDIQTEDILLSTTHLLFIGEGNYGILTRIEEISGNPA